jgi:hypothetical protein
MTPGWWAGHRAPSARVLHGGGRQTKLVLSPVHVERAFPRSSTITSPMSPTTVITTAMIGRYGTRQPPCPG